MALKEYKAKRDFRRTREPAGRVRSAKSALPAFVVQKHAATRLHYDFRLEMEGVLKSWAVPKGFPTRKGDKRLAVEVEDHPIEYGDFEGTIPKGNYGAGTVMLWDTGTYRVSGDDPPRALAEGKLHLFLKGKTLKGEWTLVRMRRREREDKPQWLLLKSGEDVPEISAAQDDRSVQTRRSMAQIARANDKQWQSDRARSSRDSDLQLEARSKRLSRASAGRGAKTPNSKLQTPNKLQIPSSKAATHARSPSLERRHLPKMSPQFMDPMKALLSEKLPKGPEWIYELKFDGVRALGIGQNGKIELVSRAEKDLTSKYHEIADALSGLAAKEFVLDGEIVAVDKEGRSSFQLLQSYYVPSGFKPQLLYYVFDVLNLDDHDLRSLPLEERKGIAESLLQDAPDRIRFSAAIRADSARLIKAMQARGLEGLIAKRKDSKYESGRRSGAWIKFKWTSEQEFVIGGYTEPKGARTQFGALLVGYYEKSKLLFAAKVGTGFDQRLLRSLHQKFQPLFRSECPFANLPEKSSSGRSQGLTAREMRLCTWLEPKLVCQVRFAEWTRDGHLRQPAFLGLS
jgi:bifunctional non-homologous end joining protein LigD